jgi:hypothetical protein
MTTTRQAAANRRNARHSTGPVTDAGKARSARNALKHGLTARFSVLTDEDAETYLALREALWRDLQPEGEMEHFLVERIAEGMWRGSRCMAIEVELLESERAPASTGAQGWSGAFRFGGRDIANLCAYESAIDRRMHLALRTLKLLQLARGRGDGGWPAAPAGAPAPAVRALPAIPEGERAAPAEPEAARP